MIALVGYTGFVGSNIMKYGQIDVVYNSKNIEEAYGTQPDLLIYAGLRAEKYLANQNPEKDLQTIWEAQKNIREIAPKKLVLISTIDVYPNPQEVDETSTIEKDVLQPYGANRYALECWVRETYPDALIIRLPGLFGDNIKKNFIYDYIHFIPCMLKENVWKDLVAKEPDLVSYYSLQENGFYRCRNLNTQETGVVKQMFQNTGFSALNFTDSRSAFQFYPLKRLWADIQLALENGLTIWNPATEPVYASEVYMYLSGKTFDNKISDSPANYNYRTIHAATFGGENGYIMDKQTVLEEIDRFVKEQMG